MTANAAEWIMAAATVATGAFVGWQSYTLNQTINTPFKQTIHELQVDKCLELRSSLSELDSVWKETSQEIQGLKESRERVFLISILIALELRSGNLLPEIFNDFSIQDTGNSSEYELELQALKRVWQLSLTDEELIEVHKLATQQVVNSIGEVEVNAVLTVLPRAANIVADLNQNTENQDKIELFLRLVRTVSSEGIRAVWYQMDSTSSALEKMESILKSIKALPQTPNKNPQDTARSLTYPPIISDLGDGVFLRGLEDPYIYGVNFERAPLSMLFSKFHDENPQSKINDDLNKIVELRQRSISALHALGSVATENSRNELLMRSASLPVFSSMQSTSILPTEHALLKPTLQKCENIVASESPELF